MKNITIFIIACAFLFISCNKKQANEFSMNYRPQTFEQLQSEILYKGDTNSFYDIIIKYLDEPNNAEELIYAIIMSNKSNNYWASYMVFSNLSEIYEGDKMDSIDEETAKMAIEYLEKSAKTGYEPAIDDLNKLPKDNKNMTYKEKFKLINKD